MAMYTTGIGEYQAAMATAGDHGATVTAALLIEGDASASLLRAADDHGADLVVVGAIRDQSVADRLLGTVSSDIVRRASCDVLIVRPPRGGRDGDQVVPETG